MPENVQLDTGLFCIGPQAGTFCGINTNDPNNVLMVVKNSSGDLIRTYAFLPADTFYTDTSAYPYNIIIDFKYVGPKNLSYFYTGALFYTLERVIVGKYNLSDYTQQEYSDNCIIRKWVLDEDSFTLNLVNTWYKKSDTDNYFDSFSFSVEYYELSFQTSTPAGTGNITVNEGSNISVGDTLLLGPSSDMDNYGESEYVQVESISGNTLALRSFDGSTPTANEYAINDPITLIKDLYVFSNPRPNLNASSGQVVNYGNGSDGDVIINVADTVINSYSFITDTVAYAGQTYIKVEDGSIFNINQEVLIHQTQDYANNQAGLYEFKTISNINGNILTFYEPLSHTYYSGQGNALQSEVSQVVSVPNFRNVTINNNASITAKKWDGYSGGIVVFRAADEIFCDVASLGVSVSAKGFRGGGDNGGLDGAPGDPGEGYKGLGWHNNTTVSNCVSNANGGGGGYGPTGYGGTAGGGGGNKEPGGDATDSYANIPALAQGGEAVVSNPDSFIFFAGAGGGGGDDDEQTPGGCKGGDAGGIIIIKANKIINFKADAVGEQGTDAGSAVAATGGGGAGGCVWVEAISYTEDFVDVSGGLGGYHINDTAGAGGEGFKFVPSVNNLLYLSGFLDNGTLYRLDQNNYCEVIDKNENAKYSSVKASVWNNTTGGLSFIKVNNYMTVDVYGAYENIKAQVINNVTKDFELLTVYAIDYIGTDLYFLQKAFIQVDDYGTEAVIRYDTFNYYIDTLIPYNFSTNIISNDDIIQQYQQTTLTVTVRDQFNVGVLSANVFVTYAGDVDGTLDPVSGYLITDADGKAFFTFKAGAFYEGFDIFTIKADKGNIVHGSVYTHVKLIVEQYKDFDAQVSLYTSASSIVKDINTLQVLPSISSIYISMYSKYVFGIGHYLGPYVEYDYETNLENYFTRFMGMVDTKLVQQVKVPLVSEEFSNNTPLVYNHISQVNKQSHINIVSTEVLNEYTYADQLTVSRHREGLNKDSISITQYVFIQDAKPAFWSDKVTVNTDIWFRLRPFAYSLDPNTLVVKIKEVNSQLNIDTGFIDVTTDGSYYMYDAGGGLFGIDFSYNPPQFFNNESIIYISIFVKDTAPVPNILSFEYWFKIVEDYKGPKIYNIIPPKDSIDVVLNNPISFYVTDVGIGLDIKDVELFVNDIKVLYDYEQIDAKTYKIVYDTTDKFFYGATISVHVIVIDKSKHRNTTIDTWSLTFRESTGPKVDMDNSNPKRCSRGINVRESDIVFQVYAIDGTGLDRDSISIQIGNIDYTNSVQLLPIVYHQS